MQMRYSCLITIILTLTSLFVFQPCAWAEMQIIFPMGSEVKSVSNIHVIGMSSTGEDVQVSINGKNFDKKLIKMEKGKSAYMLMTILQLQLGENDIKVIQNGDVKSFKVTKVDSPVSIADWTESLGNFHSSGKTEVCRNCHRFENISDCVNCHRDKFSGNWVHKPVKEGKCFECHEQERNFIPKEPFAETCLKCHTKLNDAMETAEYVHGPVAAGFCTICHSPHKSTDKTHLRKSVNSICTDCHVSDEQGFSFHSASSIQFHPVEGVFIEKLNKNIECSDCHNPHYSGQGMLLTSPDSESLCVKCHDGQDTRELLKVLSEKYSSN